MIVFEFKKAYSIKLGEILKPIIPVKITGPKRSLNIFMLLDSGADLSLIPYSVGEIIGLDINIENRSEVHGIGEGSIPYILCQTQLSIEDAEFPARVGWALIEEVPFILGRLDFFKNFSIDFREFDNKVILKAQSESIPA